MRPPRRRFPQFAVWTLSAHEPTLVSGSSSQGFRDSRPSLTPRPEPRTPISQEKQEHLNFGPVERRLGRFLDCFSDVFTRANKPFEVPGTRQADFDPAGSSCFRSSGVIGVLAARGKSRHLRRRPRGRCRGNQRRQFPGGSPNGSSVRFRLRAR